jgi:hypothetical protein
VLITYLRVNANNQPVEQLIEFVANTRTFAAPADVVGTKIILGWRACPSGATRRQRQVSSQRTRQPCWPAPTTARDRWE